jgi:hypothetical protein
MLIIATSNIWLNPRMSNKESAIVTFATSSTSKPYPIDCGLIARKRLSSKATRYMFSISREARRYTIK